VPTPLLYHSKPATVCGFWSSRVQLPVIAAERSCQCLQHTSVASACRALQLRVRAPQKRECKAWGGKAWVGLGLGSAHHSAHNDGLAQGFSCTYCTRQADNAPADSPLPEAHASLRQTVGSLPLEKCLQQRSAGLQTWKKPPGAWDPPGCQRSARSLASSHAHQHTRMASSPARPSSACTSHLMRCGVMQMPPVGRAERTALLGGSPCPVSDCLKEPGHVLSGVQIEAHRAY
jgi:hypothetical protein